MLIHQFMIVQSRTGTMIVGERRAGGVFVPCLAIEFYAMRGNPKCLGHQ